MQLMHNGLKDLLEIPKYVKDKKIVFLSLKTPLPDWLTKFSKSIPKYSVALQIRREYRHISMGLKASQLKDCDVIFILEAYNQHFLFLLPLLALTGKEVLIGLHGNQQFAIYSRLKALGLMYLKTYLKFFKKLNVILFEIDDYVVPEKFRLPAASKRIIPHPILAEAKPRLQPGQRLAVDTPVKIGIVGMIRADKPVGKLLEKVRQYIAASPHQCELIIGTPIAQKPKYLDELGATIYDTTKEEDYIKVLSNTDILAIHYDEERYYYRASGVISDAASCGCFIIASNYPVIQHQIEWPVTIGLTFSDFEEIGVLLDRAIAHIREKGQDNHWIWREKRSASEIAKRLFESEN